MISQEDIFNEELYSVKESLALVIPVPWAALSIECRTMLQNLSSALKQTPAPSILHLTNEELASINPLPGKMVLFGHQIEGLKLHLPASYRGSIATLSMDTDSLVKDPEGKKELWGALQLMVMPKD